jgi:hemerythrin
MALLNWNDSYSVKIRDIDLQHQKLIGLINDLHDGMRAGKGTSVLGSILNELVNYTAFHFAFEEKLFDKYGYSETSAHKKEHSDLVKQVLAYKESFDSGKSVLTIDLMNFLRDWLTKHISGSDKKYTPFLTGKGLA